LAGCALTSNLYAIYSLNLLKVKLSYVAVVHEVVCDVRLER